MPSFFSSIKAPVTNLNDKQKEIIKNYIANVKKQFDIIINNKPQEFTDLMVSFLCLALSKEETEKTLKEQMCVTISKLPKDNYIRIYDFFVSLYKLKHSDNNITCSHLNTILDSLNYDVGKIDEATIIKEAKNYLSELMNTWLSDYNHTELRSDNRPERDSSCA